MNKDATVFNRTLTTTANVFDLATKNASGLLQRGIQPILEGIRKIAPEAVKAFNVISSVGGSAFNVARAGVLQFTNAINVTNTNILGYAGNIRKAIQENGRFKDALDAIGRAGGVLKDLPNNFKNLQASVIAGVSPLQRAASAGNGLSIALVPFLTLGVAIARSIDQLGQSLGRIISDLNLFKNATLTFSQRFPEAARESAKEAERLKASFSELIKTATTPELKDKLIDAFAQSDKSAAGLKNTLKTLRGEFPEIKNQINRTLGPLDVSNFDKLKLKIETIKNAFRDTTAEARRLADQAGKTDIGNVTKGVASTVTGTEGFRPKLGPPTPIGLTDLFTPEEQKSNKFLDELFPQSAASKFVKKIKDRLTIAANSESGGFLSGVFKRLKDETGGTAGGPAGVSGAFVGVISKLGNVAKEVASGGLGALKGSLGSITGEMGIGSLAGVGIAGAIAGIGLAAINAAAKFQTLETALNGITGGKGKQALIDLQQFAAVTPFRLETAANAAIKLQSAFSGLDTKGAISILNVFTGAAAAIGATDDAINRVLLGFTQIQAAGKLTADNVRQITEALPNISQGAIIGQIAKQMSISKDEARKLYREGLIPVTTGLKAIAEAAQGVPGAATALKAQSLTFAGLLSTLKDNFTAFLSSIGGPLLAVAVVALGALNAIMIDLGVIFKAAGLIVGAFGRWLERLVEQSRNAGGWLAKIVDAVGPLVKGLLDSGKAADGAANSTKSMADSLKEAERNLDPLTRNMDAFIRALATGTVEQITKALLDFEEAQADAANSLLDSEVSILKGVVALKGARDSERKSIEAVTTAQQALKDATVEHDKEIATKTLDLTNKLNDARGKTTAANDKVAESQLKLNEILKGASAEDLEKGDIALAQAKLHLRQILEDEKKAQDELNKSQNVAVDLTGLSVDQIKSRLSVARAALAAQKALETASSKKSTEQKSIDEANAAITKRNAELEVLDATKKVEELKLKGSEKDPEVIAARKEIAGLTKEASKALDDQVAAQKELDKLKEPDLAWRKTKLGLEKDITTAQQAAAEASRQYKLAVAEAKGDKEEIVRLLGQEIKDTPGLTAVLQDTTAPQATRLDLEKKLGIELKANKKTVEETEDVQKRINGAIDTALKSGLLTQQQANVAKLKNIFGGLKPGELPTGRQDVDEFIKAALASTGGAGKKNIQDVINQTVTKVFDNFFKDNGNAPTLATGQLVTTQLLNAEAVKAVTLALAEGEKSQDEINTAIKNALQSLPGIGPLKFAQGAVIDKATPGIFGEAGREAILPLTRPMRMADIIGHPQVLPPVLAALDKISLPRINREPVTDLSGVRMVRTSPQIPDHHVQAKRDAALAKAIVAEMKDAGVSLGQTIVNNEFVAPDANDPLAKIRAAQIAREVKRQIEKLL